MLFVRDQHATGDPGGEAALPERQVPGFDHINRYYDPRIGSVVNKILPGEYYVTTGDEAITTVLGSCVAACVWDPAAGVGGMNHFMIPEGSDAEGSPIGPGRYGLFAMEFLINTVLGHGGRRANLQVKLAGGGHVVGSATDIGEQNIAFARNYLRTEGLDLVSQHVGGTHARALVFHPLSGRSAVRELSRNHRTSVAAAERRYATSVTTDRAGHTDIF